MELSSEMIRNIKNKNPAAIRLLVGRYQDYVYTLALRVLKQTQAAEEVTQDVFMKVIDKIDQYKGQAKFSTWLYTLTYRTALNHRRGHSFQQEEPLHTEIPGQTSPPGEPEERNRILWQAINSLPAPYALIITLYYLNQLRIREIAETLEIPVNTVKTHLSRGRKKLHRLLEKHYSKEELL
ncbi:MAG TPA: RNA polymerase sigma factor [Caldithrix abyssi]|uniref:RNA polymerase sigma factor n=1 Tax=Caldithrix abyssi TaxID=187145 RepID=A0A7V5VE24_CALAY|nr:RNA polymerase sigma factor [Caldithrix abyssi]